MASAPWLAWPLTCCDDESASEGTGVDDYKKGIIALMSVTVHLCRLGEYPLLTVSLWSFFFARRLAFLLLSLSSADAAFTAAPSASGGCGCFALAMFAMPASQPFCFGCVDVCCCRRRRRQVLQQSVSRRSVRLSLVYTNANRQTADQPFVCVWAQASSPNVHGHHLTCYSILLCKI